MRRRVWVAAGSLAAVIAAGVAGRTAFGAGKPERSAMPVVAFTERADRDVQIRVWNQALAADSLSAIALGQLAALHLQRAREGGSWSDYLAAETFARRSLALRTNRNGSTASTLANILMAQHRFVEAQFVATQLVRREPDIAEYRALLGEISMELGDYALAGQMFDSLWLDRARLTIAARLSRWAELNGNVKLATRLIDSARVSGLSRRDVPKETKAWYELRAGEIEFRAGKPRSARRHFESGLQIEANDPRLLSAMARLSLSEHRYMNAVEWGERAIAIQLDPEMLGVIGDAYAGLGDTSRARESYDAMDASITGVEGPFHRAWMLQLLDRGVRVAEMLERSQREYETRRDIYGADVYAWALFKAGRRDQAAAIMRQALRLGTRDPLLQRHARDLGVTED